MGVISSDLSLHLLAEAISKEKPYPNAYFMLLGEDGRYYVHPDTTRLSNQTIFSDIDARRQADIIALGHEMTSGHKGSMVVQVNGNPSLVCYGPVTGTKWSLALVCPESDILRSYYQLSNIVAVLIIIGLILITWFCRKIVADAIRPLNRLVEQTRRLAAGDYDEEIRHSSRQDAVGRLQNSFIAMQDSLKRHVGDIQKMNDEMAQRNEELQRASLLVEKSDRQKTVFIQNMTHQIRTPLNIIMGFAQVLRDDVEDMPAEEVSKMTAMMEHNAMTLNRMVLMLYDSSDTGISEEMNSQEYEYVSCNELARDCIESTRLHFPYLPIAFETELPDTLCIHTNRFYLMRSLREILYNSAKYSDGQHVSLHVSATDTLVRFVFEDTGPGIDESYFGEMFVPFTKVNDLSEGLGLGLPLSKRHIINLGGNLTLDPHYHGGCRFIVELPLAHPVTTEKQ